VRNHTLWFVFCGVFLVAGCAMEPEMSLMESLNTATSPTAQSAVVATEEETGSEETAVPAAGGILNETDRAATLAHLKALSAERQAPQHRSLSTSAAEMKRLGSSHADEALGEIENNPPQN
jgi:cytochrome bd-type quinol oxidase subunit 1